MFVTLFVCLFVNNITRKSLTDIVTKLSNYTIFSNKVTQKIAGCMCSAIHEPVRYGAIACVTAMSVIFSECRGQRRTRFVCLEDKVKPNKHSTWTWYLDII